MADEATPVELYGENEGGAQRRFTCASGVTIVKGTVLKLVDPRTAAASAGTADVFAGIASMDKESGLDASTSISCWENGIFEMKASGAIVIGAPVQTATGGLNTVMAALTGPAGSSGAQIVGYALETASADEIINIRINN